MNIRTIKQRTHSNSRMLKATWTINFADLNLDLDSTKLDNKMIFNKIEILKKFFPTTCDSIAHWDSDFREAGYIGVSQDLVIDYTLFSASITDQYNEINKWCEDNIQSEIVATGTTFWVLNSHHAEFFILRWVKNEK